MASADEKKYLKKKLEKRLKARAERLKKKAGKPQNVSVVKKHATPKRKKAIKTAPEPVEETIESTEGGTNA